MEKSRTKEAEKQRQLAEERVALAEGRAERVEHAFDVYRSEQRRTPEAALQVRLLYRPTVP
eukprot:1194478-Prorocentrum_minimum.AAC.2